MSEILADIIALAEHFGGVAAWVSLTVAAVFTLAYLGTKLWASGRKGIDEVVAQKDQEYDKLVALLKEQNASLVESRKVDEENMTALREEVAALNGKVDVLAALLVEFACGKAPTCGRRQCPNRSDVAGVVLGDAKDLFDGASVGGTDTE
ncbi:MAG: hypothetical protein Q7W30_07765 [Coriobacteriia bacterium]|nr:hypothetical protein [Coriobacteriia bacterium]